MKSFSPLGTHSLARNVSLAGASLVHSEPIDASFLRVSLGVVNLGATMVAKVRRYRQVKHQYFESRLRIRLAGCLTRYCGNCACKSRRRPRDREVGRIILGERLVNMEMVRDGVAQSPVSKCALLFLFAHAERSGVFFFCA
ncbi:MAG TPA: hypothetical protein VGP76_31060 [Planctomycetaceae bacterium]|jgi:hypothetical protein|nr:hypothetical protein [Planctomycetaceae bacterium]